MAGQRIIIQLHKTHETERTNLDGYRAVEDAA